MAKGKDVDKQLWQVDPALFEPGPRATLSRRLALFLKPIAQLLLLASALSAPLVLTILGIVYGGLVFWGGLAGLTLLVWFTVSKLGYASNFDSKDIDLAKKLLGVTVGLFAAAGFFLGLFRLGAWLVPVVIVVLAGALIYALKR